MSEKLVEIYNHCGKSVSFDSGLFINRIPDFNDLMSRIANRLMFPAGDFVCRECDLKSSANEQDTYESVNV